MLYIILQISCYVQEYILIFGHVLLWASYDVLKNMQIYFKPNKMFVFYSININDIQFTLFPLLVNGTTWKYAALEQGIIYYKMYCKAISAGVETWIGHLKKILSEIFVMLLLIFTVFIEKLWDVIAIICHIITKVCNFTGNICNVIMIIHNRYPEYS